jgi:hypothetical protein
MDLLSANGEKPLEMRPTTVRPEEPPSFGGVWKGVRARESTLPGRAGVRVIR